MALLRQFTALMWKNWLLKKRNSLASACEVLLPIFFIVVMVIIYGLFSNDITPTTALTSPSDIRGVLPISILPSRLLSSRQRLALVPRTPAERPLVDRFLADMAALHPALNGSTIGGAGFQNRTLRRLYVPGFADIARIFDSEKDLEDYITGTGYDRDWEASAAGTKIFGAIIFNSGAPAWDYNIRMNVSMTPSTAGDKVDVLRRGHSFSEIDKYVESSISTTGPPFLRDPGTELTLQPFPGFLSLQLAMDRWILNTSVPVATLNPTTVLSHFNYAISRLLPRALAAEAILDLRRINSTDPARAAAILAEGAEWLRDETYAPQQVEFVPFPYRGYSSNGFYGLVLSILSFFLVIGYVYPVSRLIRGIVLEKEMKIREGMKMMGLSDAALFGSWLATYTIFFALLALVITLVSGRNMFKASDKGYIWLIFFLFGLSSTTLSYLISVFFSRAKTASSLGIVLFIAAYFPTFSVSDADVTTGTKNAASLLCPTAFGLAINIAGQLEDSGAGVTAETVSAVIRNYSMSSALGMMVLDTFLYAFLAWYADNVLPASVREFGVPRVWYFPVTASYWREVLNLPTTAGAQGDREQGTPTSAAVSPLAIISRILGRGRRASSVLTSASSSSAAAASVTKPARAAVDASYLEEADSNMRAREREGRCVSIRKLRKEFDTPDGTKVAVDNVDLTMYEGQIFVLLGHNGAGKTTTISMLTGLTPPTSGGATIFGKDLLTQLTDVRRTLGVCPQHDVLWPELTVKEHLQIFTAIKDVPRAKCEEEIKKSIAEVGLTEKVNALSSALSGGQKRKLSVCIALAGGSKIIFLDEPTSGMDPYSRRSTWQILQNAREGRVMVMSTHFMDEADILGDRIGIMADGRVQCCGSPTFLKQRFGVGYILTLIKSKPSAPVADILALIRSFVPEASVATNVGAELNLRLPLGASAFFPPMLHALDARLAALSIASYGISITSIEDVFLKISAGEAFSGSGSPTSPDSLLLVDTTKADKLDSESSVTAISVAGKDAGFPGRPGSAGQAAAVVAPAPQPSTRSLETVLASARKEQTGFQTFVRHTSALLKKRWNYSKRDGKALAYQILLPFFLIAIGLALIQSGQVNTFPSYQFSTAQFNTDRRKDPNLPILPNLVPAFKFKAGVGAADSPNVMSALNAIPSANITLNEPGLFLGTGDLGSIQDEFAFIDDLTEPRRTYQLMSTLLLSDAPKRKATKYGAYVWTRDKTILSSQDATQAFPTSPVATYAVFYNSSAKHGAPTFLNLQNSALYKLATNGAGSISARNHPLPRTERESALFAGLLVFSASLIIIIAFSFQASATALYVVREREVAAKHQQLISGVSLISYHVSNYIFDLFIYAISGILAILLAFAFRIKEFTDADSERLPTFILTFFFYGLALIGSTYLLSYFFKSPSSAQNTILFINISAILLIAASQFLSQIGSACRAEQAIRYVFRLLPSFSFGWNLVTLAFLTPLPIIDASCDNFNGIVRPATDYLPYKGLELKAGGTSLVFLAVEGVVYFFAVLAVEYVLSQPKLLRYFRADPAVPDVAAPDDEDVALEAQRVAAQAASPAGISDVVVIDSLRKVYPGGKVAVKGLSYGIPVGEVFGFLGINGAGKTTTLQMLSGDVLPTAGTAKLAGYDIISQQNTVRRLLGYCPQFDALLDLLTVREHLELYARIKGVPEKEVTSVVETKLTEMDLRQFANKKAGTLSGGNKRKLSVAIALIGDPPIVFLDEPSTGMDPVARRFMWSVISRVATERKQCSIILTTHSMEEVEALCTRIGIMVGGRLRCLGTAQHLKNRHGQGYMSELKLQEIPESGLTALTAAALPLLGGASASAPVPTIARPQVGPLAGALGDPASINEITEAGTGWAVHAAFAKSATGTIPLRDFLTWWAAEQAAKNLVAYMAEVFPGSSVIERQGTTLRFRIPARGETLATLFEKLEGARAGRGVMSYTLGQTTLEQIFVQFASTQDEETGVARGMAARQQPLKGAAAAV